MIDGHQRWLPLAGFDFAGGTPVLTKAGEGPDKVPALHPRMAARCCGR